MNYKKYSKDTQKYMKTVEKFLREKYGSVQPEWDEQLHLLANNINLYGQCEDDILNRGLIIVAKNGAPVRNPNVQLQLDIQKQIVKLVAEFGLSPKSVGVIDKNIKSDDSENEAEELADLMMN